MKKPITLSVLLLMCATTLLAQWVSDPKVNTVISADEFQTLVKVKQTTDGKFFVSWLKWEDGMNGYIKLQLLDKDGNPQWEDGGIYVSKHITATWTSDYSLEVTPDGCAVIVHSDSRTDPSERQDFIPYAYKIDQEGNQLWGLDGIALPCEGNRGHRPRIGVTKAGNVVIGYSNTITGNFTIQRINPDGTFGWAQSIELGGMMGNFITCGEDDFIVVWYGGGIVAQRFDAYGDAVWGEPVVIESREFNGKVEPNLIPDGKDGFVISHQRFVSLSEFYACLQRVTSEGELTMGLEPIDTSNEIGEHSAAGIGVNPEKEQIITFWDCSIAGSVHLKVNKFTYNGDCMWGEKGIELDTKYMWGYVSADAIMLPDESSIIVYGNYLGSIDIDLTVQKLDKDGNSLWIKTLGATCYIGKPQTIFSEKEAYIFWNDNRVSGNSSGYGYVYGQNITYDGEFGPSSIDVKHFNADNSIYYDNTHRRFNINVAEVSSIDIYDIHGTLMKKIQLATGENMIPVDLPQGVYLVRLLIKDNSISQKLIVR